MIRFRVLAGGLVLAALVLFVSRSESQPGKRPPAPPDRSAPRLEPVAETKLLMAGMARPNFDGLVKTLQEKPAGAEGWAFARGQALIVAETGNLLLIRPPQEKASRDVWMTRAMDLRESGTKLARAAAAKDYLAARAGLADLANTCNRCHAAFQVPTRVNPLDPIPD